MIGASGRPWGRREAGLDERTVDRAVAALDDDGDDVDAAAADMASSLFIYLLAAC